MKLIFTAIYPAKVRRPLGETQHFFLKCVREHGDFWQGCGWTWGGWAQSYRLAHSLVYRGLLEVFEDPARGLRFKITAAGRDALNAPAPVNTKERTKI